MHDETTPDIDPNAISAETLQASICVLQVELERLRLERAGAAAKLLHHQSELADQVMLQRHLDEQLAGRQRALVELMGKVQAGWTVRLPPHEAMLSRSQTRLTPEAKR